MTWLARGEIVAGNDAGPYVTDGPTKLVLHTTEGGSIEGAIAAYRASNSWPHMTYDPATRRLVQHVDLDLAARAAYNGPGGGQTNRAGRCVQVELIGHAADTPGWPDHHLRAIAQDIVLPIRAAVGLDARGLRCYGPGPGWVLAHEGAPQRIADFEGYGGLIGHQHLPENDHWDPGGLDMARLLQLTGGGQLVDPVAGDITSIPGLSGKPAAAEQPPKADPMSADDARWLRDYFSYDPSGAKAPDGVTPAALPHIYWMWQGLTAKIDAIERNVAGLVGQLLQRDIELREHVRAGTAPSAEDVARALITQLGQ